MVGEVDGVREEDGVVVDFGAGVGAQCERGDDGVGVPSDYGVVVSFTGGCGRGGLGAGVRHGGEKSGG